MTNNKQQTAVEWLYNELLNSEPNILEWNKLLQQAKEMEKERIENAWVAALDFGIEKMKGLNDLESKDAFEQYYNETFGGNND